LEHDPDSARRLLADAGYPGGKGLPVIDLLFPTTLNDEKTCEVLARMWETELGVKVELRGKEPKTFAEDKVQGRYMIARAGWYGDYRDPTTFLDVFRSQDGNNDAGYASETFDGLLSKAERELDAVRRNRMLAEAEGLLIRADCPVLPLHQRTNLMAVKPHVRGLWPNSRLNFPFRYVSVER
jgi:ABC-type oligopeptide transport system substrate-binding subunit